MSEVWPNKAKKLYVDQIWPKSCMLTKYGQKAVKCCMAKYGQRALKLVKGCKLICNKYF